MLNAFLFSSLNMEIVYAILRGVDLVLRDINGIDKNGQIMLGQGEKVSGLTREDYTDNRTKKLKKIRVIPREVFEKMNAKEMRKMAEDQMMNFSEQESKYQSERGMKIKDEMVEIDASVTSYAPKVFRYLRAIDGVNELDVMQSISPKENRL